MARSGTKSQTNDITTESQAAIQKLIATARVARDPSGTVFLLVDEGPLRAVPLNSEWAKGHLVRAFFEDTGRVIGADSLKDVILRLSELAAIEPAVGIGIRVGAGRGFVEIDLADRDGHVVRIDKGWFEIRSTSTLPFLRRQGMLPLPLPDCNCGFLAEEVAQVWAWERQEHIVLVCAYLIGALNPLIASPLLQIVGPQGSAKSTLERGLRRIIDPHGVPLRTMPENLRDLYIGAHNNYMLAFDNLSGISRSISDALCCIVTGGGHAARKLYTDDSESLIVVRRPVVISGICPTVTRPDLLDRTITIALPPISATERMTDAAFWARFEAALPRILGALYDAVSAALLFADEIQVTKLPRLADWYAWVLAAVKSAHLGVTTAEFEEIFWQSRADANDVALDDSCVGRFIVKLAQREAGWTGTQSQLLEDVSGLAGDRVSRSREWPSSPQALRRELDRIAVNLASAGVCMTFTRAKSKNRDRIVELSWRRESS